MNRYKNIIEQRLDEKHKRRKHNSSITPKIESTTEDIYIIARDGDRLDLLAYEYYDDESREFIEQLFKKDIETFGYKFGE